MAEHIYMFSGKSVNVRMVAKKHLMNELVDWFGKDFKIRKGLGASKAAMARKIAAQDAEIAALKEALARLEAKVGK